MSWTSSQLRRAGDQEPQCRSLGDQSDLEFLLVKYPDSWCDESNIFASSIMLDAVKR